MPVMPVYISVLNLEEPKALWYPESGYKTIVVGRKPISGRFTPEPGEAVHWDMPDLDYIDTSFSRRMISMFCSQTGTLTIKRLSATNSVRVSSEFDTIGQFLSVGQRYTVQPHELYNFNILIHGCVALRTQSVGWSSPQRPRILTMIRTK